MAEKEVGERNKMEVKREKKKETRGKKDGLTASVEGRRWGENIRDFLPLKILRISSHCIKDFFPLY